MLLFSAGTDAECFYKTLQNSRIQISYIIEDMTIEHREKFIPGTDPSFLLSRNASSYPDVDAIIITDIVYEKQIRQRLKGEPIVLFTVHTI